MNQAKQGKKFSYKLGIVLLIISLSIWLIPAITPFTPLSIKMKAVVMTSAIIAAEVLFWAGTILVGKEVVMKYRARLNPKNWRKQQNEE